MRRPRSEVERALRGRVRWYSSTDRSTLHSTHCSVHSATSIQFIHVPGTEIILVQSNSVLKYGYTNCPLTALFTFTRVGSGANTRTSSITWTTHGVIQCTNTLYRMDTLHALFIYMYTLRYRIITIVSVVQLALIDSELIGLLQFIAHRSSFVHCSFVRK